MCATSYAWRVFIGSSIIVASFFYLLFPYLNSGTNLDDQVIF